MSRTRIFLSAAALLLVISACGGGGESIDMAALPEFQPIEPGDYFLNLFGPESPNESLRVDFSIESPGWNSWVGTYKEAAEDQSVILTVASPTEVVVDPCHDQTWRSPGTAAADFASALAALPGMTLVTPPSPVTAFGHPGQHLVIEVSPAGFVGCTAGEFYGWRAAEIAGPENELTRRYQGPGQRLEIWVLDVEGKPVLIEKATFSLSPAADVAELDALLESIEIEG